MACPVVLIEWIGEGELEVEVVVLIGQVIEIVFVENLLLRAGAIPEGDFAGGVLGFEQVRYVGTQRCHTRAAANIDHFFLGRLDMKVAK